MSDTPRTDAAVIRDKMILSEVGPLEIVDAGTSRQLERELAEARAECERLHEDAERYQWLRMNRLWLKANLPMIHAGAFDAAIDAARRK